MSLQSLMDKFATQAGLALTAGKPGLIYGNWYLDQYKNGFLPVVIPNKGPDGQTSYTAGVFVSPRTGIHGQHLSNYEERRALSGSKEDSDIEFIADERQMAKGTTLKEAIAEVERLNIVQAKIPGMKRVSNKEMKNVETLVHRMYAYDGQSENIVTQKLYDIGSKLQVRTEAPMTPMDGSAKSSVTLPNVTP